MRNRKYLKPLATLLVGLSANASATVDIVNNQNFKQKLIFQQNQDLQSEFILKKLDNIEKYAAHRSHRSHSSHRSHYSARTGGGYNSIPSSPSKPPSTKDIITVVPDGALTIINGIPVYEVKKK